MRTKPNDLVTDKYANAGAFSGLTKREYFALELAKKFETTRFKMEDIALNSVKLADMIFYELNKEKKNE